MTLLYLSAAALTAGFGLGFVKFFLLGELSQSYPLLDKAWIIQAVGALITAGPFLAYMVAAPTAASFHKRRVMCFSAAATAVMLGVGGIGGWTGGAWMYLFMTGLLTGLFNSAKNAAIPLEAARGGRTTETINASLNVAYIVGLMAGIPAGAAFVEGNRRWGEIILCASFAAAAVFGGFCRYDNEAKHLGHFKTSVRRLLADTAVLLRRHTFFLLVSPLLWGIGSAASLAITAYAEYMKLGTATQCSLMAVYSVIGVITGNFAAAALQPIRKAAIVLGCAGMAVLTFSVPMWVSHFASPIPAENLTLYAAVALAMGLLGLLFGAATNLIEAEYFRRVYDERQEGTGAALLSANTALFPFLLGGFTAVALSYGWLSAAAQFAWLGMLALAGAAMALCLNLSSRSDPPWQRAAAYLIRRALRLRYNVTVTGFEKLDALSKLLILPNHPAEIDPVIIATELWRRAPVRPVMLERYYRLPVIHAMMRRIGAIPMPDMEAGSGLYTRKRVQAAMTESISALSRGENVLIYPSGRIMRGGNERLGGTSAVNQILRAEPGARVVLVRTRGLYGSVFSSALTGSSPDFLAAVRTAIKILLRNLIFFAPRREVLVHIEPAPEDFPRGAQSYELNRWLEDWYNAPGTEALSLVSHSRWRTQPPAVAEFESSLEKSVQVPPSVREKVTRLLAEKSGVPDDRILPGQHLGSDLALDSLSIAEILAWLETEYLVNDVEMAELTTVGAVMRAAAGHVATAEDAAPQPMWVTETSRAAPRVPRHRTIAAAFLENARRMGSSAAVADDQRGIVSYRRLLLIVLVLAARIRRLAGRRIGIMLPASAGSGPVVIAAILAGKVPVMLNWTLGRRGLEHAAAQAGLQAIVTSGQFVDRIEADLAAIDDKFVFLEDVRRGLRLRNHAAAWLLSLLPQRLILRRFNVNHKEGETAVILFTSGSESAPKGVPLSHRNILANICSAMQLFGFKADDVILGFLPPFHSFGLTTTLFMPVLCGIRAAYHPNPNESRRLALACAKWRITVTAGTPAFLSGLLRAAVPSHLTSLRLMVSGAEKAPESLFALARGAGVELVEGYGITECSPVVCVTQPGKPSKGVGPAVPGVELRIVHPETLAPLAPGETGLILIAGDNVFGGYLDGARNRLIEIEGKRWFNSGDLGRLEGEDLVIGGRQSRFIKIAGEMISLPAIEHALTHAWQPDSAEPVVAVVPREDGPRVSLYAFTPLSRSKEEANQVLREAGFGNIVRLQHVLQVETLPLLGTGKVDYRRLSSMLEAQISG